MILPDAFVWTKIQADAGEAIERILERKDLERQAGDGQFWWGIGESKAKAISLLITKTPRPEVLFSLMLSPPHRRDKSPGGVLLWQGYETSKGKRPLPRHVVVTSRAHASNGSPKAQHYALVCESKSSILQAGGDTLNVGMVRNIGDGGKPIGSSQITAVVEISPAKATRPIYQITARATLGAPFFAVLTSPRELAPYERQLLDDAGNGRAREDWPAIVRQLRGV